MRTVLRKTTGSPSARRSAGFTIIEVAIAMLVLSVGLLGVAGLQATGIQSTYQSHQRSVAMAQARGLPPKVLPCSPGRNTSMTSLLESTAEMG